MFPMSAYIFNQIVPQLSLGSGLASSDPVTFKPKFITQKNWMIQAQYFWMHSNGTGYALCGTLINVTAGDIIETRIAFEPDTGSMVASIGVKGGSADQRSQITSTRPFPNEHPPLWNTWAEFFKAAQNLSATTEGPGVLNHADFNVRGLLFLLSLLCACSAVECEIDWCDGVRADRNTWRPTRCALRHLPVCSDEVRGTEPAGWAAEMGQLASFR